MSDTTHPPCATVAEAYLVVLRDRGVRNLYLNAGTDFAPIVEAYARADLGEDLLPVPVLAAHENVAAGMAHGAYLMTGQPQAIMVHVSVGTANAACAVLNAARENVPLIVIAGRSPILEEGPASARDTTIQWGQELYDQAAIIREGVKWDYELRDSRQLTDVIDRAMCIATSHPRGPVYLTLPREVLAETLPPRYCVPPADVAYPTGPAPDTDAIENLAQRLTDAEFPVMVASSVGADRHAAELLAQFCERFGVGIVEPQPRYVNAPADHPFHLGYRAEDGLGLADIACYLECSVPWVPRKSSPGSNVFVVQAGPDPLSAQIPMRSHRSDLTIVATSSNLLNALTKAMIRRGPIDIQRTRRLADASDAVKARQERASALACVDAGPITPEYLSVVVGEEMMADRQMVFFNEYWALIEHIRPSRPGSYFLLPQAGGLGWALPAALGAKHAAAEKTVVAAVGDGAYFFANPAACHHAAAKHGLPILTIVANNARWGAVDWATRSMYPNGEAARNSEVRLSSLAPMPAFELYVQASGGYGERVTARTDLPAAFQRALHAVRVERRQALLNVICA
jgi:acetolactate synthase-1/2/3 large subunit